jgi:hypothetical protein
MQRCPKCNRTYQDDSQKFCTFDGGRLMVDTEAPTTFDLGPAPQGSDPLGATVMGPGPDLNKTVAGTPSPLTSEIPPSAPTGPTNATAPTWHDAPPNSTSQQPPAPPQSPTPTAPMQTSAPTGPTTTSPLAAPPTGNQPAPSGAISGGFNAPAVQPPAPQTGPVANVPAAPPSGGLGAPSTSATAARPKSSRLPLLIGGLALLFLLLIAGGAGFYFLAMKPKVETSRNSGPTLEKDSNTTNTNANSNANTNNADAGVTASQPPVTPPPNSTKFVNSRDKLTGSLAEHFVDFSFYYPNNWIVDPKAGTSGSSNFFRASRHFEDKADGYVLENMTVSWYQSNGTMQLDRPIFPNRVEYFNNLLPKEFPEYQKINEGETTVGGLQGYQLTFKSTVKGTANGDVNFWGRVIFLPAGSEDAKSGVVLIMVASSDLPEIKGIDDVGTKGELPTILKTFRFGV